MSSSSSEFYPWADVVCDAGDPTKIVELRSGLGDGVAARHVACGLFSFSQPDLLRTALSGAADFVGGLDTYVRLQGMRATEAQRWYDFGHLHLLYSSRRDMLVSRSFNTIRCDGRSIIKESSHSEKIEAEALWFERLPHELRPYVPQYMGRGVENGKLNYKLEYLFLPTLAELSVFGRLPEYTWRRILTHLLDFMGQCHAYRPPPEDPLCERSACEALFDRLIRQKSRERIVEFLTRRGWELDASVQVNGACTPPLIEIVDALIQSVRPTDPDDIALVHGDLFFGNILYDFRAGRVRVIDPRGSFGDDKPTLYSDKRYDLAKLAHSIVGGYDWLLSGRGGFHQSDERTYTVENHSLLGSGLLQDFMKRRMGDTLLFTDDILAMTALLFFSMLPLHAEDPERQNAFLATGVHLSRMTNIWGQL